MFTPPPKDCPFPTVEGCNYLGEECTSNHSGYNAVDDIWKGLGTWDTCAGPDKSVIINVTRPDGIPSIDGIFIRVAKPATGATVVMKYYDDDTSTWVMWGTAGPLPADGVRDLSFNFPGVEGAALWQVEFFDICPKVIEIGFNGTCPTFITPAPSPPPPPKECPYPTVEGCNSLGGACMSGDSAYNAVDDNWHGPASWDTCAGPDKSVIINVSSSDGVPSIDGIFIRLSEPAPGAKLIVRYYVDDMWVTMGIPEEGDDILGLEKDFPLNWAGRQAALWEVEFTGVCPHVIEIGFNGTCPPFVMATPAPTPAPAPVLMMAGFVTAPSIRRQTADPEVYVESDGSDLGNKVFSSYVEISAAPQAEGAPPTQIRYTIDSVNVDCATSPLMGPDGVLLSSPGVLQARACGENGAASPITQVGFSVEPGYDLIMHTTITSPTPLSPDQMKAIREEIAATVGIDARTLALVMTFIDDEEADSVSQKVDAEFASPTNSMRSTTLSKATQENMQTAVSRVCESCVITIDSIEMKNKGKLISFSDNSGDVVQDNSKDNSTLPVLNQVEEAINDFASSKGALAVYILVPLVLVLALFVWYRRSRKAAIDERAAWLKKGQDFVKPIVVQCKDATGRDAASRQPDFVIAGDVVEVDEDKEVADMDALSFRVDDLEEGSERLAARISNIPEGLLEHMYSNSGSSWGLQNNSEAQAKLASDRSKGFQDFVQPTVVQSKCVNGGKGAGFNPEFLIASDVVQVNGANSDREPAMMEPYSLRENGGDRRLTETICDVPAGIIEKAGSTRGSALWDLQSGNDLPKGRSMSSSKGSDLSKGFQEFVQPSVVQSKYLPGGKGAGMDPEFVITSDVVASAGENVAQMDPAQIAQMDSFRIDSTPGSGAASAQMTPRGIASMTPRSWLGSQSSFQSTDDPIYHSASSGVHTFYPTSVRSRIHRINASLVFDCSNELHAANKDVSLAVEGDEEVRARLSFDESAPSISPHKGETVLEVDEDDCELEVAVLPVAAHSQPLWARPARSQSALTDCSLDTDTDTMSQRSWAPYPRNDDTASVRSSRTNNTSNTSPRS